MRLVAALAVVGACSNAPPAKVPPYTQRITQDLDLLFVMDNSPSTPEPLVVAQSFSSFVQALDALPNGRPNLHIGVVTSTVDIGVAGFAPGCPSPAPDDNGLLVNAPREASACSGPNGRFISDVADASGRITNYDGPLDQAFACIAQVGNTGCGFEAQLEGMKRALDGTRPENAGFLRPTADLGVLVVTDEDDCSVADNTLFSLDASQVGPGDFRCQPLFAYDCDPPISATQPGTYDNCRVKTGSYLHDPAEYNQFLSQLVGPNNYFVTVIGGDPSTTIQTAMLTTPISEPLALMPSCSMTLDSQSAIARPGNRLADFVGRAGGDGLYQSACQSDYSGVLRNFAGLVAQAESGCIRGLIDATDTDASNPGRQPSCTVTSGGAALSACAMLDDATPDPASAGCYYVVRDTSCTSSPDGLALRVAGSFPSQPIELSCTAAVAVAD